MPQASRAQSTSGWYGGSCNGATGGGGGGGAISATGTGGPGAASVGCGGGGGGGAGVTGGNGGDTGSAAGGAGGASPGANGSPGDNFYFAKGGGGGGGGGAHGAVITTSTSNSGIVAGGNGGAGGSPMVAVPGAGGGGGGGGYGAVIDGGGLSYTNTGTVRGGAGGGGGFSVFNNGGYGGFAGAGIVFTGSGGTLVNSGSIAGGAGGIPGSGVAYGLPGLGGVGVTGANLSITNSGSITGGLAGDGSMRARAIYFNGGINTLELQAGSIITGDVVGNYIDTLRLGGAADSSFDASALGTQYTGFTTFVKTGTGTWTLTGTTPLVPTPWTIDQGTLAVSSDGNLGNASFSPLTFNGGTLQFLAGFDSSRSVTLDAGGGSFDTGGNDVTLSGAIGGAGGLTKTGSDTLTLTNGNSYAGGTTISAGTLQVDGSIVSATTVRNTGTLTGRGSVGNVTVESGGTLSAGGSAGTLTVAGNLALNSGSMLNVALGNPGSMLSPASGTSSRIVVSGDLAFDGTVNLSRSTNPADGTAGIGYYRLITYGGALTSNTATIGTIPALAGADLYQLQAGSGRVDLFIGAAGAAGDDTLQLWQGGDGAWNASNLQWLNQNSTTPVAWAGNNAVFRNANGFIGGNITVEGAQSFKGLQFVDDGYRIDGAGQLVTDAPGSEIRVLADNAAIAARITGAGGIVKTEAGTLTLTGVDTYAGGTTVKAGTLVVNGGAIGGTIPSVSNGPMIVGDASGDSAALRVGNGGAVNSYGIDAVGRQAGSTGTVTITGAGSTWVDTTLNIGVDGNGSLRIDSGGAVASTVVTLGVDAGGSGSVTVSNGGQWRPAGLAVGAGGTGTVDVAGSAVTSFYADIGRETGGAGTVTLTGGSSWTFANGSALNIGNSGTGHLVVDGASTISGGNSGNIGLGAGSIGDVTVIGGSSWTLVQNLMIGAAGTGSLTIGSGSTVTSRFGEIGQAAGSDGTLTLTDGGRLKWTLAGMSPFFVGDAGTGTLNIGAYDLSGTAGFLPGNISAITTGTGSGTVNFNQTDDVVLVTPIEGSIAVNQRGTGTTTLTGANSYTGGTIVNRGMLVFDGGGVSPSGQVNSDIVVGSAGGDNGTLRIIGGAKVTDRFGSIGVAAGSIGTVTVSGTGSTWSNSSQLSVGVEGTGRLNIEDGGRIVSGSGGGIASIGSLAGSTGTVTVTGAGSSWKAQGLNVGTGGSGVLTIADGAMVDSGLSIIGAAQGGGTVAVTGPGSTWTTNALYVGSGGKGDLTITNGGTVSSLNNTYIGGAGGPGTVTVTGSASSLTASGTLAIGWAGAGTLNIGAYDLSDTAGTVTAASVVSGTGTGTVNFNQTNAITFAMPIAGNIAVNQRGTGTAILAGTNSYTGGTSVRGGVLSVSSDANLGAVTGALTIDGGTLQVTGTSFTGTTRTINWGAAGGGFDIADPANAFTVDSPLGGVGSLTKSGTGSLILTGENSYTGGTTISGGTLQLGNGGSGGSILGNVIDNGALTFNRSDALTFAGAISGSGAVNQIGTGTTILTSSNSYAGDTTIAAGALQFGDGASGGSSNLGGNLTVAGGSLAIAMPATLSIAHNVAFADNTSLSIAASPNGATLSADSVTIGNGVAFNITGVNEASQVDKVLIDTRSGISGNFAMVTVGGISGTVDYLTVSTHKSADDLQYLASYGLSWMAANSQAHGTFTLTNASDTFTVGMALTDQAANPATGWDGRSLTKAGAGTLILSADNSYTGGTTISGGVLQLGSGGATGSIVGDVVDNGVLAFNRSGAQTFAGKISGSGAVEQVGGGTTILTGDNSYIGGTRIDAGVLSVSRDANLGDPSGGIVFNGGTLATTAAFGTTRSILLPADGRFNVAGAITLDLGGPIGGSGNLVKLGMGTLLLTGANTYAGDTLVQAGTLIGDVGAIRGNVANAGTVEFAQATKASFAGDISGLGGANGVMVKSGAGDLTLTGTSGLDWTIESGRLNTAAERFNGNATIRSGAGLAFALSGSASYAGVLSGAGAFDLTGSGALTFTGDSSAFTGTTTISAATLRVDGTLGGDVAARSGGVLTGSGRIIGNADLTGGGVFAGMSGRTLRVNGNVTLDSTSVLNVAVGGASSTALVDVGGNLALNGTLNITDAGGFGAGVYRLIDYGGSLSGAGLAIGARPSGVSASDLSVQTAVANQVNLISSANIALGFWDGGNAALHDNGAVDGGSGVWSADGRNWTQADGTLNGAFAPNPTYAVFQNVGGVVTVDGTAGAIGVTGMQFATDGYRVEGDPITLNGAGGSTSIRVGDGTAAGASSVAMIGSILTGNSALVKDDLGTLILTAANSYTGGTTIAAGTLQIGNAGTAGSITGDVSNDGTLAFNRFDDFTFAGVISGSGSIDKLGPDTVTLTGNSGAFAGATSVTGGTLAVNGQLGGSVSVLSGGTLAGTGTVGAVSVANGGTLSGVQGQTLTTGNLALSSGSNVNVSLGAPGNVTGLFNVGGNLTLDGTLNVADAGGFGQGVYRIVDYSGSLTDNGMNVGAIPTGTGIIQTAIANQVNLVVDNGGPVPTVQFWNGATTVADGTIHGGNGVWSAGPATSWTNANGTLAWAWGGNFAVFQNNPGNVTVDSSAGAISTAGMQFIGTGWTVAGDPITLNGTGGSTSIRVGDGTAAGASSVAMIGSILTGNSALVKDDLGTLILTAANSYTGGTTIAAGTLQIGNAGTGGSIAGNVTNNGTLAFNRTDATSFGGLISGSGAIKLLTGGLTLTADNSYGGGTDIAAGSALRLGNGGTTGAIVGNVNDNGALVFNRSNDLAFAGVIGGSGSIRQIGSGKVDLTGNSSGFTGTTTVESGTLAVNGQLGGTLDIWAAGRLQGTGTVGNTVVSGTIAPGNSIGTINVGNITFNAGSIYEVEVNAAGQSDKIAASGTATINGGSVKVLAGAGNYAPATQYTILTANGGRTGTFTDGVTSNLAFLDPSLSYDANNVYLTMTRNDIDFAAVGLTPNQIATGGGAESLGFGNPVYNAVLNLSAAQAQYAFDQLSGEIHASAKTAMIEDSRFVRNAVNDRLRAAFDGVGASGGPVSAYVDGKPVAVPPTTDGGAIWGQAFGSWGNWNSDANAARLDRSIGGFFMGADAPAFDTWRFGAIAGYSRTTFNVKDRHSSGTSDNYTVGLYGGSTWNVSGGDLAFRSGAAYTVHNISTNRSVAFSGFIDTLKGDYHADTAQVFGELGYGMTMGAARFEPFANLAYVNVHTGDFTEQGGAAALTSLSSNTDATFTTLGLRDSITFDLGGAPLAAKSTLSWRHAFGDVTPDSVMRFAASGDAFSIGGVPIARDAAVVEAGLDYMMSKTVTLHVSYGGQFGSGVTDQSVNASFNVKF
ncbi:MAG: autotransporter-associated beta strand repeat-containing protein [Sphingobium sp.]|nr:autotransporter-associated beta strand repeat-containing protein [Sphingobium sp.]